MEAARERLCSLMNKARASYLTRIRSAGIVALLMAALLWFTKWPGLRPGLWILLAGQISVIFILLRRSLAISREIERVRATLTGEHIPAEWFDGETLFVTRLGAIEDLIRTLGFLMLGYGLWIATGSVLIAFALGVVYPAFAYFGMERRKHLQAKRILQAEKAGVIALLD